MNAIELRNLTEQVEKNKQDILKHFQRDEVLADFGIRVIGQVETEEELLALPTEGLEYGDAYAVGTQSPFNYYIWTRANNISDVDYWFAFGEIAIVGPQGPKGDKGDTGLTGQSTRWYLVSDANWTYDATGKKPGDMVLTYPSGQVYMMGDSGYFTATGNIKGPQGIEGKAGATGPQGPQGIPGPKGDTGDVGGFINIAGIVNTEYDLPDPELIGNLTVAYLVGFDEPYDLYIQVGSNSRVAEWFNAGPLNVATYVSAGGVFQNVWNADTKVDKVSTTAGNPRAYIVTQNGQQEVRGITQTPQVAYYIACYGNKLTLKTATPTEPLDCVNLEYFNANAGGGGGWKSVQYEGFSQNGQVALPGELKGHHINLMVAVDYHKFSDWSERHTALFGPTPWRLEGSNLPAMTRSITGFTDDAEIPAPILELNGSAYSNHVMTTTNITFSINSGSTDFYNPEITFYYQDLGPSFVKYP